MHTAGSCRKSTQAKKKKKQKTDKQPFTHSEPKQTSKHVKQKHPYPFQKEK